ncbi:unnamed protein product [Closterium sp. Yama58-4]|nr:unnamed protein product [Closterium sp. Yama58-4]
MLSPGGFMFGIVNIVGNFGAVFLDNGYWMSAIASRPSSTHRGYILGGLVWFAVPFSLGTSLGLSSLALGLPVTLEEASRGLVPPAAAVALMGDAGAVLILVMVFMAVTSAGSAELLAVSSLMTYDIYRTYINPRATGRQILFYSRVFVLTYGLFMGVLAVGLSELRVSLGWMYLVMGVLIGSAVIPVTNLLLWKKANAVGAIAGCIIGMISGVVSWITVAVVMYGTVDLNSTGEEAPTLTGNLVSLFVGGIVHVAFSLKYPDDYDYASTKAITLYPDDYDYASTRAITLVDRDWHSDIPPWEHDETRLKQARHWIILWGVCLSVVLLALWPLLALPAGVFSLGYFTFWVVIAITWGVVASAVIIFLPVYENWRGLWLVLDGLFTSDILQEKVDDIGLRLAAIMATIPEAEARYLQYKREIYELRHRSSGVPSSANSMEEDDFEFEGPVSSRVAPTNGQEAAGAGRTKSSTDRLKAGGAVSSGSDGGGGGGEVEEVGEEEVEEVEEEVDIYPMEDEQASFPAAVAAADDHATTTILTLRACVEEKDATIKKLQSQLDEAHADLHKWRSAFHPANILAPETTAEPAAVVAAFEAVREAEAQLQEKLLAARRREAAMLIRLAGREQEVVAVNEQLQQVLESMQPASTQTRSLLLDAAIHAEFKRLKTESEALERRVRELQDDLAAVQFTPHSKNGKMLMAKCRTLQEENEDIGREAAEGKVHELENKLALQKQLNSELKRGYQELQEYVDEINEEAEKLEETVYKLQRQLQLRDAEVQELSRFKANKRKKQHKEHADGKHGYQGHHSQHANHSHHLHHRSSSDEESDGEHSSRHSHHKNRHGYSEDHSHRHDHSHSHGHRSHEGEEHQHRKHHRHHDEEQSAIHHQHHHHHKHRHEQHHKHSSHHSHDATHPHHHNPHKHHHHHHQEHRKDHHHEHHHDHKHHKRHQHEAERVDHHHSHHHHHPHGHHHKRHKDQRRPTDARLPPSIAGIPPGPLTDFAFWVRRTFLSKDAFEPPQPPPYSINLSKDQAVLLLNVLAFGYAATAVTVKLMQELHGGPGAGGEVGGALAGAAAVTAAGVAVGEAISTPVGEVVSDVIGGGFFSGLLGEGVFEGMFGSGAVGYPLFGSLDTSVEFAIRFLFATIGLGGFALVRHVARIHHERTHQKEATWGEKVLGNFRNSWDAAWDMWGNTGLSNPMTALLGEGATDGGETNNRGSNGRGETEPEEEKVKKKGRRGQGGKEGLAAGVWESMVGGSKKERRERKAMVVGGVELGVWMFVTYAGQAIGLETTSADDAALILTVSVVLVPFLEALSGTPINRSVWIATLLACTGMVMLEGGETITAVAVAATPADIIASSASASSNAIADTAAAALASVPVQWSLPVGHVWCLIGAVGSAIHVVRSEVLCARYDPLILVILQLGTTAAIGVVWVLLSLAGIALTAGGSAVAGADGSGAVIAWNQLLAVAAAAPISMALLAGPFGTGMCEWLEMEALRFVRASTATLILTMSPLWGSLLAFFLLGETLSTSTAAGAILILLASLEVQLLAPHADGEDEEGEEGYEQYVQEGKGGWLGFGKKW